MLRPDKGNGLATLNRKDYICGMNNIINERSKFKLLIADPASLQEGQLQRFLRKLKDEGFFNANVYKSVYPTGSRPARMYVYLNYMKRSTLYQHLDQYYRQ